MKKDVKVDSPLTSDILQLKAAGLFKHVWPFSGHQTLKGQRIGEAGRCAIILLAVNFLIINKQKIKHSGRLQYNWRFTGKDRFKRNLIILRTAWVHKYTLPWGFFLYVKLYMRNVFWILMKFCPRASIFLLNFLVSKWLSSHGNFS